MANDMTHANYTHGFSGGVTIRGMPVLNSYGGNVYWVDSAGAANGAGTFQRPFLTIDAAVGNCTANNGDIIMVKPGHAETVSAAAGLDLDVAGITIMFLGNDSDRGTITFDTDVLADMDVDAADITMIGPRFVMGLDNVTAPIDVNAARFKLINVTLEDAAGFAPPDWIVADASADDFTIDGLLYRESTTGTQNQSLIQIAAADRPVIRNVRATGNFGTAIIENGTAWIDATIENVVLDNANVGPTVCVLLQTTSTGWMRNSSLRVSSGTTYVTADNDMQFSEVFGTGTDATTGEEVGTQLAGGLEAKIDVIDGYFDVPTVDGTADTTMRDVIGRKTDAAAAGAVSATESIMAYSKQIVTELQVVDGYFDVPTVDGTADTTMRDVVGRKTDAAAAGAVSATESVMAYAKQVVTEIQLPSADSTDNAFLRDVVGIKTDAAQVTVGTTRSLMGYLKGLMNSTIRTIEKTDGAVLNGKDSLFTITGGPIRVKSMIGIVTTVIGDNACNGTLQADVTTPAGTVALSTTVAITSDAAGTMYHFVGASGVLTPVTVGAAILDLGSATVAQAEWIVPIGDINFLGSAANTGVIKWYMTYEPLSPSAVVTASA